MTYADEQLVRITDWVCGTKGLMVEVTGQCIG